VTVTNAGTVELFGTGSVLRVNTLAVMNGGTVTNRVRQLAGGVDVTNKAATSLVLTNGGTMHLAFEQDPVVTGHFWGLKWAGSTHAADLQALVDAGKLTWSVSALYGSYQGVGIYTNDTDTYVGVYVERLAPKGMLLIVR
jgi:hypothetical protein